MGAFVGAGINSYKKYAMTGNYDKDAVINFLLYNFWNSLIIGLPTLILGISAALFVCMFGLITWKKITNSYIKVEYKIISIKAWPKQERSADDLSYFFEKERFEDKRRKIFRWILATPIILALLMAL